VRLHTAVKFIFVLINSFILHDGLAQTFYTPKAKYKFDSLYKELPASFRRNQLRLKDYDNGFAMFVEFKIDTLNADDLPGGYHTDAVLMELAEKTANNGVPRRPTSKRDDEILTVPCYAGFSHDTLVIQVGMLFFGQQIVHIITKNNLSTSYDVYRKYDSVFTLNESEPPSDGLDMPAENVKFSLSDALLKPGEIIYGNAELTTKIYYEQDESDENSFLKLRGRFKYYFKVIIQKGGKHDY
jgi:hypothetical protein